MSCCAPAAGLARSLLLLVADISAWHTGLVPGCRYHSHQGESPLLSESLASDLKPEGGWPVFDQVVTCALKGGRYEDLAI